MIAVDQGNGGKHERVRVGPTLSALVVLGCSFRFDEAGRLRRGILRRRIEAAERAYFERGSDGTVVVASGGRRWCGLLEADVIAEELAHRGVPESVIVRERRSRTTRENALLSVALLDLHSRRAAAVVTSEWHLRRALALFRSAGLPAEGVGASDPEETLPFARAWQYWRERLLCRAQTR
ncbi:MAG: YdcF family protein [Myxococcota bacterium]|nr:YdcF family protein [Myxococcota bacterium]